ncbi:hypothetical protein [Cellulophaga fucicola]|uniref:DKNYY family protein n=1 Tax=Cellulophaga fucicola TaxID=76595 RepID=A0A1K1QWH6_9FLAO|nr:hypothetical protein [Cellulophaga fucicola]SFW64133.1 hypothetical protein SAMN05660313_03033 [Cellulophaga fucicola]
MKQKLLITLIFLSVIACKLAPDTTKPDTSTKDKKKTTKDTLYYNGFKASYVTLSKPKLDFPNHMQLDYFEFKPKDSLKTPQYTYPNKESVYINYPNKERSYGGYVYKGYEDWVVRKNQSLHYVDYNYKDSTCVIYTAPKGNLYLRKEDIKITKKYYKKELIKTLEVKDSLGEKYIVNNVSGSRFYWYPHKDSVFPEYQYDRLNNRPTKTLALYESRFVYEPTLYKDWYVYKNSFQIRSYDSIKQYSTNYQTDFGYVFTPKSDYIKENNIKIKESLLTEIIDYNRTDKKTKIDSLLDITVSNKLEFDTYKEQKEHITYNQNIKKEENTLTLPIKNEPYKIVLEDSFGEYTMRNKYNGEIPFLDAYIIEFNDPDYIVNKLISKTTGKEIITLDGQPYISPNSNIIISAMPNGYDNTSFIQFNKIKNGKIEPLYSFQFPHWVIDYHPKIRWVNNNTIILQAISPIHSNAFYNKQEEKIEYLKIKIKDAFFNKLIEENNK